MPTEKSELDVSIEEVTHAVAEITKMDTIIAELHQKYDKVIFDVDGPDGMKAAKAARKDIREPRYLIESLRKDGKKPILGLGRKLDGRAAEMTDRLLALENPIDNTIKEEESRLERERQAKIDAELKRVEDIQARISGIREHAIAANSFGITAKEVKQSINDIEAIETDDSFSELIDQARDAKTSTLVTLNDIHTAIVMREEAEAKASVEREELAKLRAEQGKRIAEEQAKREAAEAEARAKHEAEEKAEREKFEIRRKEQVEAQAKIDAENKRLADEKATREKAEQKDRAAQEKAEADAKKAEFPGTPAIIKALCEHFDVTEIVIKKWLKVLK